ncbi:MAG: phosphatidate cytidylyltransferase [Leptospirales bacterium]|nr:phosphatidate cytidylyltransferase [Leptospirales bacterium]
MKYLHVKPNVLYGFGGVFALLLIATIIVVALRLLNRNKDYTELTLRIKSWWAMIALLFVALATNETVTLIFFATVSFLALKEFLSLIPTRRADRRVLLVAFLCIPIQYLLVYISWYGVFIILIPVYAFLFLPLCMVTIGETQGFLRAVGTLHWGLMTTVFCVSHGAYLLALPEEGNPVGGGVGLVLFLLFLTQLNDVAQFVWGKALGRHKITPRVSPNKTWEGFVGGVATTTGAAWLIAPYLTPIPHPYSLAFGAAIGVAGFFGDVTISALKRDLQVKDSGDLLPGHGGILDRIDSLVFTSPLFFHLVYWQYY